MQRCHEILNHSIILLSPCLPKILKLIYNILLVPFAQLLVFLFLFLTASLFNVSIHNDNLLGVQRQAPITAPNGGGNREGCGYQHPKMALCHRASFAMPRSEIWSVNN